MASQWRRDNQDGPADRSPHFFKIILPNAVQEGKLILDKFMKKYGVDLSDMAFITIPNVFKYEGNSHFDVLIFDATAIEIDYTLDKELQVRRMEDDESDDRSVEIIKHFYRGEGSRSAHPKKDGGVAENLVRANAFKLENPLFTVIIRPSYVNGKDRVSLPRGIINYLLREDFTKDYTKASILTVKL
ncbi:uncharacterized protein LOC115994719 [Quercus lobata]|uniref:uncharacterized protein LOC115994719 n=1 Tax=Quercus lobata TaxID=97700 RepID=UPI0012488652|nr:uncharacterized protein LOC115994719 [Quercus lobata]